MLWEVWQKVPLDPSLELVLTRSHWDFVGDVLFIILLPSHPRLSQSALCCFSLTLGDSNSISSFIAACCIGLMDLLQSWIYVQNSHGDMIPHIVPSLLYSVKYLTLNYFIQNELDKANIFHYWNDLFWEENPILVLHPPNRTDSSLYKAHVGEVS